MKNKVIGLILILILSMFTYAYAEAPAEAETAPIGSEDPNMITETTNPDGDTISMESSENNQTDDSYKHLDSTVTFEKAIVLEVKSEEHDNSGYIAVTQSAKVKLLTGKFKDEIRYIENVMTGNKTYDIPLEVDVKVLMQMEEYEDGTFELFVMDYVRDDYIIWLLVIFILAILYVGRSKGIKTFVTLLVTVLMIFKVHLPLLLAGYNPVLVTIVVASLITVITMVFISGFRKKTLAAILGTMLGVIIAGGISFYIGAKVKLTGLSSEEAGMLMFIPQGIEFNFQYLLFSGILLGALGAVMDVSMSIASAIDEMHSLNPLLPWKKLYVSGMTVGKDIMGTMSNTLILAYTGSTMPLLLLFMAYDTPLVKMINLDVIATEIIRSLAGSIGLVLTIPITATIAVLLLKDTNKTE